MSKRLSTALMLAAAFAPTACGSKRPPAPVTAASAPAPTFSDALAPEAILRAMTAVGDWQLGNPSKWPTYAWHQAAFWAGVAAFAPLAPDARYFEAIRKNGETNEWKLGPRPTHADDHAIAQSYFLLHAASRDQRMIAPALAHFDGLLKRPYDESLEWKDKVNEREWAWCDALFMAPPALAIAATTTGRSQYLDLMVRQWWKTADYLYDRDEHLFFRDSRFFDKKEPNGKKTFWSRGNGWVLAGLARVLQHLPAQHPERPRFLALFREMATRIVALQAADGYWRASLLDPGSMPGPETSGTGFFTYAFTWGVNQGLLERAAYEPAIRKGWSALVRAIQPSGMLGFVQRVGDRPGDTAADRTEVYGAGAFLLAGAELHRMTLLGGSPQLTRTLKNPHDEPRLDEVVELPLEPEEAKAVAAGAHLAAVDGTSGAFLPTQLYAAQEGAAADRLLVLASFLPAEERAVHVFRVSAGAASLPPARPRAFGRVVPERVDFAWENERVAFRVYGPKVAQKPGEGSGIDVWAKRVRTPVIDLWYKRDDYHKDHGEGLDFYNVGPSRGCGGVGLLRDGKLVASGNFTSARRVAAGPLRVAFELSYEAWGAEGAKLAETKRISLDAGSSLSRIEVRFAAAKEGAPKLPLAVGIQHRGEGPTTVAPDGAFASYWEPPQKEKDDGQIGCGVVMAVPGARALEADGHTLLVSDHPADKPFVYFAGAAWSKGLDFHTAEEWTDELKTVIRKQGAPIGVTLKRTDNRVSTAQR